MFTLLTVRDCLRFLCHDYIINHPLHKNFRVSLLSSECETVTSSSKLRNKNRLTCGFQNKKRGGMFTSTLN